MPKKTEWEEVRLYEGYDSWVQINYKFKFPLTKKQFKQFLKDYGDCLTKEAHNE